MPWLSLPEYSRRTGTPESTVRLMIRDGRLRAELEPRAPGDSRVVWKVWMDEPQEASESSTVADAPSESPQPQTATTEPPAAITRLLDTVERQGQEIADLNRRLGAAEATAAMLERQRADLARWLAERDETIAELRRRPWWRRLWGDL